MYKVSIQRTYLPLDTMSLQKNLNELQKPSYRLLLLNIFDFPKQQRSCPEGAERVDYLVSPSLKRKNLKM